MKRRAHRQGVSPGTESAASAARERTSPTFKQLAATLPRPARASRAASQASRLSAVPSSSAALGADADCNGKKDTAA
eukprot:scaffold115069_cov21-Prasinocladus_malaysianus.AAC.1